MIEMLESAIAAWNRGDLDGYMELYADDVELFGYTPEPMDKTGVRSFYEGIQAGLPGSTITLLATVEQGDRLAVRFVQHGRHDGELMGVPATGREVELNGMTFLTFRNGRVCERWSVADVLGLMTQLGALPAPTAARS